MTSDAPEEEPPIVMPEAAVPEWLVPRARGPVRAVVQLPGSKSMTNRALVLAALSDQPTVISRPLVARDTRLMADALRALGCRIEEADGSWLVEPVSALGQSRLGADDHRRTRIAIDVGNAGTVLRFVPPIAALISADVTFRGDPRAAQRPVAPLLTSLRTLGVTISDTGTAALPFVVHGRGAVPGGAVTMDASASSQFVSALLLAAARFETGTRITHEGPRVPSEPHIEMSVSMLIAAGVDVRADTTLPASASPVTRRTWHVLPGPIRPGEITVEPDLSNAVPFLAAALATGGEVTVAGWPVNSLQPAARIIELLRSMGADVRLTSEGLRVSGSGQISGVGADLGEVSEVAPVLTALAALASSPSEFTGIGHMRRHESDRLAALASEIGKLGGDVTELADGLRIRPVPLRGDAEFNSHDDHRLVMAAAVLGLVTDGVRVQNAATVGKTFPGFSRLWSEILAPGAPSERTARSAP
ncbi:MAG: 3-phosphoshikimate 1-carboxyvinyltransferase [Nocardiopsaceae bacterium]|jgi:3-phosphoshikimate 1-carboxyvinyltransferase|nr:3-phosphoshikimate 1-carboxyvinyltransferase [Nocardiopsaceae bacterium]